MGITIHINAATLGEERPRLIKKIDHHIDGGRRRHAGEHEPALKAGAGLALTDADDAGAGQSGARRHEAGQVELEIGGSIGGIFDAAAAHKERDSGGEKRDDAAYSSQLARLRIHLSASPVSWNQDMP